MMSGPPEGALMRRHAGGIGCGARGREVTHLPHSGGAGAPPGGQYELPARSMANSGAGTARLRLRQCAKPGGRNGRLPQSAAGAVRKTPAMARHEAPAFSRGNAASERTMVAPPGAPSPSIAEGQERRRRTWRRQKIRAMTRAPMSARCCLTIEYVNTHARPRLRRGRLQRGPGFLQDCCKTVARLDSC